MTDPSVDRPISQAPAGNPGDLPGARPFPGDAPLPTAPAVRGPVAPVRSPWRYLLPAALFVLAVAGIAWVTQFMPSWRSRRAPAPVTPAAAPDPHVRFAYTVGLWDKQDPDYIREVEKGHTGHFDFPFESLSAGPLELGLLRTSCDCSHLKVCVAPAGEWQAYQQALLADPLTAKAGDWSWTKVGKEDNGFAVPPGGKGFVRVEWDGKREPGTPLRLALEVWIQPKGDSRNRQGERLEVSIRIAWPARVQPARVNIGPLGPGQTASAQYVVWSSTRPSLDLKLDLKDDPLLTGAVAPLSAEQRQAAQAELEKESEIKLRIRSAYRVTLQLQEQKGEHQLDQGAFYRAVPLLLDGESFPGGPPLMLGSVKGDIEVGAAEHKGKVSLGTFQAKQGIPKNEAKVVPLWTPADIKLEWLRHEPETLEVKLTKKDTANGKTHWQLQVSVPPRGVQGPLPETSAIFLRTQANPPRFLRIPVVGNGQS